MPTPKKQKQSVYTGWSVLWEVVKVVGISLAIVLVVKTFLFQPFYVKGASMEPNFEDNEYLLIDELSYRWREPARGEVVVFRYPQDPSQYFIKRIIGQPGERVQVVGGQVLINGAAVDEGAYLGPTIATVGSLDVTLSANQFFLMGDNRPASLDSRIFGPVDRKYIVGRTWLRAWPVSRWEKFEPAAYNSLPSTPNL